MATPTYTLIGSSTVGAGGAASITFSSIVSTYTDLLVKVSGRTDYAGAGGGSPLRDNLNFYVNGLASSGNWSGKQLYGIPGIVNGSGSYSASNSAAVSYVNGSGNTANSFGTAELYIPNYSSTSINKSASAEGLSESNDSAIGLQLNAILYSSTSAITSITLFSGNGGSFVQYSTAYLYGIKNS